jgi:hypothetical protein
VVAVGGALLRVGGEQGKAVVERAARDPLTQVDVKRGLIALLPRSQDGASVGGMVKPRARETQKRGPSAPLIPPGEAPKSANVAQTSREL